MKKSLNLILTFTLILGFSTVTFATSSIDNNFETLTKPVNYINSTDIKNLNTEKLNDFTISNIDTRFPKDVSILDNNPTVKSFSNTKNNRGAWFLNDPYGVVDGNLSTQNDFYLVENTSDTYAFLKLTADDPNLLAILYYMDEEGNLTGSTGFGVYANDSFDYVGLPPGQYAIVIGSSNGEARGAYSLHWNRSNPFRQGNETVKPLIISNDLMQIVLYYNDKKILNNGHNVVSDYSYEYNRELYVPSGYGYYKTSISNVYDTGSMFLGNFSYMDGDGHTSYSTNNALIVEARRSAYTYIERYYQNINGNVVSKMSWNDPFTDLKSPRPLGDDELDRELGPHYVVFDLNTNELVDFVSLFNYPYMRLGREAHMSNLQQIK